MGGKGGGKFRVSEYYMSLHIGICTYGRNLELLNLKVGEKIAWEGRLRQNDVRRINRPNLFGGQQKEGGLNGLMWWLNGNEKQRLPGTLAERLGLTYNTCPGFRGFASIFLTGLRVTNTLGLEHWPGFKNAVGRGSDTEGGWLDRLIRALGGAHEGFMLSANIPYLKTISVRVRRAPEGLNPSIALIRIKDSSTGRAQYAANPAHIVFEAMTNPDFGMGESWSAFDIGSFEECAQTLYDEKFGLNLLWARQNSIEEFIKDVLDHIQGAVYVDPATGKHTMKLLRGDYAVDTLPIINPDNAKLTNFRRKVWGEISNEVVVTWTNPETNKEETVTAQDLAAISAQGGISSTSRNYHAIASQETALVAAERDLAALVHPIITLDAEVTRELWKSVVHGVVRLSWPEYGVADAVFRISKVTNGSTSRTIKMSLYEDVFSLDQSAYLGEPDTSWTDPSLPPAPLTTYYLGTAPAFMVAAVLGLEDPGSIRYPEAVSLLLVSPNTEDDVGYELVTQATNAVGEPTPLTLGERQLAGSWLLTEPWQQEARTTIPRPYVLGGILNAGDFLMVAGANDAESEICVVRNITSEGNAVIDRGLLDTTPKAWPVSTRVYVIPQMSVAPDDSRRSAGEVVTYQMLTQTSQGMLDINDAPEISQTITQRPHLPLRPANVRVGNSAYGSYTLSDSATEVLVTWSNRNRVEESTQAMLWNGGDVPPEAGQTTEIEIVHPTSGAILKTIAGLTGNSHPLTRDDMMGNSYVLVRVVSRRDGRRSLQGHTIGLSANLDI